jgi:hypothetical protein
VDTKQLENIAEDRISHELSNANLLVAKPRFDQQGTDLVAFMEMRDGVKFCRIQCKGRNITRSNCSIRIPSSYVSNAFIVVLYLDIGSSRNLYCFFASEIQEWRKTRDDQYQLSLNASNAEVKLAPNLLGPPRLEQIKSMIRRADVSGEFGRLVCGRATLNVNSRIRASATVTSRRAST